MTDSGTTQPKRGPLKTAVTIIVAMFGIVAVVASGILVTTMIWTVVDLTRQQLPLRDLLSTSSDISPIEDTRMLCAEMKCIEGWRTDVGVFLRFRTKDMAEYWQYVIGADSVRYENSLLDMSGLDLTRDERRLAIDTLFSRRDWQVI